MFKLHKSPLFSLLIILGIATPVVAYIGPPSRLNLHDQRTVGVVKVTSIGSRAVAVHSTNPTFKYSGKTRNYSRNIEYAGKAACSRGHGAVAVPTKYERLAQFRLDCRKFKAKKQWRPLSRYWHKASKDNFTTGSVFGHAAARQKGYKEVTVEAMVRLTSKGTKTRPLQFWYHPTRKDFMTIASPASIARAKREGYKKGRTIGYIYKSSSIQDQGKVVPLTLWWHAGRKDYWTIGHREHIAVAKRSGYKKIGTEGYGRRIAAYKNNRPR